MHNPWYRDLKRRPGPADRSSMQHSRRAPSQEGFTLMELLVVIAVLGALGSVAVVAVPQLTAQAQLRSCEADRVALRTAQSAHHIQHGAFTTEDELVSVGLLSGPSELHDITVSGDTYELVGVAGCAQNSDELVLVQWAAVQRPDAFRFGPAGEVSVSGIGERQAIATADPFSSGVIDIRGARSTQGSGWGVVVHAGINDAGQIRGYVFQMDTGYSGGRFVLRQRDGGESRPLAVTAPAAGFDWGAPHDIRLELDANALRALVDGETVMQVPDLAAAARAAGSNYVAHTEGSVGLRLWSSSDLEVASIATSRR